jgi:hypothetical protein
MSKRKIARKNPRTKKARTAPETKPAPHPLAEAEALFKDGEPRADLTMLEIIRAFFDTPHRQRSGNPTVDFLSDVMATVADELRIAHLNDGLDNHDLIDRVLLRAEWRMTFAAELARRVEKGEVLR